MVEANDARVVAEEQDHVMEGTMLMYEDIFDICENLAERLLPIGGKWLEVVSCLVEWVLVGWVDLALN